MDRAVPIGSHPRIMKRVKESGLCSPHPPEYGGKGIGFLKLAYMNEILAWSPYSNPAFGIMAPNSRNQKILVKYGPENVTKVWVSGNTFWMGERRIGARYLESRSGKLR